MNAIADQVCSRVTDLPKGSASERTLRSWSLERDGDDDACCAAHHQRRDERLFECERKSHQQTRQKRKAGARQVDETGQQDGEGMADGDGEDANEDCY